jgi:uncharacterized protein (DUF1800 family)
MKVLATFLLTLGLNACGGGGGGGGTAPSTPPPTATTPPAEPTALQLQAAAKLLDMGTFGPTFIDIDAAARQTPESWLSDQFGLPVRQHMPVVQRYIAEHGFDLGADVPPGLYRRFAFWESALTAPDQLRQLTAYALTQIMVVSDNVGVLFNDPRALSSYYDVLLAHAFGNYRDLLRAVTLHPAMGVYLSHVNNGRSDPVANTFPDENYAREVMQLFSIGLFELNPDGSQQLDINGQSIPTYDNADIREFSKIFTGLSYGPEQAGGASFFGNQQPVLHVPMVMFEDFHEPGEKRLLNGVVVPDGQTGVEDLDAAIDNLFNHPNVGPFIGKQLIQRLVTSNPSPAYIGRVTEAFNGDGSNSRGDMQRVLRAILLDPEAAEGIRLREPFRRYVALNRSLRATSSDGTFPVLGYVSQFFVQQNVLSAPSVFNFYLPSFSPSGEIGDAALVAPEFQITNASTIVGMSNLVAYALYTPESLDTPDGFADINLDLSEYTNLADDSAALLDRIDLVFFAGTMPTNTRSTIAGIVDTLGADALTRTQVALYLALTSADYAVAGGA